jgi:MFS family permease
MSKQGQPPVRSGFLSELSRDGRLLFITCALRSFTYGFLSVVLGLYLAALGLRPQEIGGIFTAALAGSAVMTVVLTSVADRFGRKRILVGAATLMALAGVVLATTTNPFLLVLAAALGSVSPSGKEVGPFLSIEQAILPQMVRADHRTATFSTYNLVGSLAGALGAIAVGLPSVFGFSSMEGYRLMVWGHVLASVVLLLLFASLSPGVEPRESGAISLHRPGLHRSRGVVTKLAILFAIDAFAGGFIMQSLVAYWFHLRYGADTKALGLIFFGTNFLSALSFLAAAPVARRIGLLNTMVFTHLFSNVLLLMVPWMPGLELTVVLLLLRHLFSQLDVPTRQSYTMAVIDPDERSAAAGITSVTRNLAASFSPAFAGATLAAPALGLPFLIAGGLKIAYDLSIFVLFRRVKPPEEAARRARTGAGIDG